MALGADRPRVLWLVLRDVALLVTLGMLAGYLPARRAASLPPMDALREE